MLTPEMDAITPHDDTGVPGVRKGWMSRHGQRLLTGHCTEGHLMAHEVASWEGLTDDVVDREEGLLDVGGLKIVLDYT